MLLARLGLELAVVEFDDLAFLNVGGQFVALRQTEEGAGELLGVHFDVADGSGLGIEGFLHHLEGAVAFEGDDVVDGAKVGRDIDLLAIDEDMAVVDELAGAGASAGEAHAIDEVVETGLEDAEEGEAGDGFLVGFGDEEQAAELTLIHAIEGAELLLLEELGAVFAVLARAVGPFLEFVSGLKDGEIEVTGFLPRRFGVPGHYFMSPFFALQSQECLLHLPGCRILSAP